MPAASAAAINTPAAVNGSCPSPASGTPAAPPSATSAQGGSGGPTAIEPSPLPGSDPAAPSAPAEAVLDPATIAARANKNDQNLNFLAYQHMDQLFDKRMVPAGTKTWELPRSKRSLPADFAFDSGGTRTTLTQFMMDARMNALLVMKDGEIVTEIYRHGSDASTRFIAMSMSKSFLSALYGIAIQEGLVKSVDEPIVTYLPELKGTAYERPTIKNLLMMRAGNAWSENGDGLGVQRGLALDEEKAYYEDYASQVMATSAPGTTFNYSTLDSCVLGWALSRAVGRDIADYTAERLWVPAGMERDGYWIMQGPRGKQREFFGAGLNATLRDLGRFGQLMLDGGMANGIQVVPKAWVSESTDRGTPPAMYMYQWWGGEGTTDFSALGQAGQTINVDPTNRTVIVILSYFYPEPPAGLQAPLLRAIKSALQ